MQVGRSVGWKCRSKLQVEREISRTGTLGQNKAACVTKTLVMQCCALSHHLPSSSSASSHFRGKQNTLWLGKHNRREIPNE